MGWIGDLEPYYRRLNKKDLWDTLPIVVVIDDGNGYRSIYAHFSKVRVKAGDVVKAGQLIGWEGDTGRASGCHLHYGLFSPYETKRFGLHPDTAKRMKLPRWEVARVNPLRVLPYREGISPASMKPGLTGVSATPTCDPDRPQPRRAAGGCRPFRPFRPHPCTAVSRTCQR